MKRPLKSLRQRSGQRGIVAVLAVIFLITAVVFVLVQSLNISGTTSIDNKQQLDSTRALFLAESGLEQAHAKIALSKSNCCKVATGCPNGFMDNASIGSGSYTFSTPVASPSSCAVTVVGQVGSARRTITQNFNFAGTTAFCNTANATTPDCSNVSANPLLTPPVNPTWSLTLPSGTGVGIFNLAANGDVGVTSLNPAASSSSVKQWENKGPSSASATVLSVGHTVIPQGTDTSVYQVINKTDSDTALSGVVFPGATFVGKYVSGTVGGTTISGTTTDGLNAGWCGGVSNGVITQPEANTLVMGFSAHTSQARTDGLAAVLFDARNGGGITMQQMARTPRIATPSNDPDALASNKVYSEIWYKQNEPFHQGFWIVGKVIGIPQTLSKFKPANGEAYANLTDDDSAYLVDGKNIVLTVGMPIDVTGCPGASNPGTFVTITGFGSACSVTSQQNAVKNLKICWSTTQWTASSSGQCNVKAAASPSSAMLLVKANSEYFQYGSGTNTGQTLAGIGITNGTVLDTSTNIPAGYTGYAKAWNLTQYSAPTLDEAMVVDGATVTTSAVTLPSTNQFDSTKPPQIVSVVPLTILAPVAAGNSLNSGQLPPNTILTGQTSSVPSGTTATASVSNGAILCGGTCAFFNHSATSTTFSSALPTGTDAWASGFVCLRGASAPQAVTGGGSATAGRWHEVIQ